MTQQELDARLHAYSIDQRIERDRRATKEEIAKKHAAFEERMARALSTRPETQPIPAGTRLRLDPDAQRYLRKRLADDLAASHTPPARAAPRGASPAPRPPTAAEIEAAVQRFRRSALGEP